MAMEFLSDHQVAGRLPGPLPGRHARLRLSGRTTYKERVVPLHEDAASALQAVIDLRKDAPERPLVDERTGEEIRYLFISHGKLLSGHYLFETPMQDVFKAVGLSVPVAGRSGRGTVTAHRFRHTVGTQLEGRGAKLRTIMKVLGRLADLGQPVNDPGGTPLRDLDAPSGGLTQLPLCAAVDGPYAGEAAARRFRSPVAP